MKFPVFLANVQAVMEERRWDQSELAHQVETTQSTVSRWGYTSIPRGQTLAVLASLAGVEPVEMISTPLADARKSKRASIPSGKKLVEVMEALLDSSGLPHLADEYAPKLARLLPGLLADSALPTDAPGKASGRRPGAKSQDRATTDRDKQP